MSLLNIPTEILDDVVMLVFQAAGLDEATKLRLVCQRFNALVQQFMFRLPEAVLASKRMSETMRVKLIQSKILSGRSNNLCNTINYTADFLTRRTSPEFRGRYVHFLVRLAAKSMFHWDLVHCLSTEDRHISSHEIRENALVAAAAANQHQLVEELLAENVSVASNTRYFGEAFAAAASSGSLRIVSTLLQNCTWDDHEHLMNARFMHAVCAAAEAGHDDLVLLLLDRGPPLTEPLYDDTIIRTAKTSKASMVELLLSRRRQHSDPKAEKAFWETLIRSTVEWNNRELLLHIMPESLSKLGDSSIGLAVEDGCRRGHYESVQMLLSSLPNLRARATALYTGGLFWIARSGTPESLGEFMKPFHQEMRHITRALAGAISGKRSSTTTNLLRCAGVGITNQDPPSRFTDAVRLMLPEAFSIVTEEHSRPLEELAENLREASSSDDLVEVIKIFQTAKTQHPDDNLIVFSAAFSAAAKNNHPDILLYLCENRNPHLATNCASSAAVLQIFMDFGWDFNQGDPSSKFGRLGNFFYDEHFCRWLISNGASVSATGDWDVTPISVAVNKAPMSTIRLFLEYCGGILGGQLLHFAINRDNEDVLEVIELLLNLGCPINSIQFQDDPRAWMEVKFGEPGTPLFTAVQNGKRDIVAYLLSRGADPLRPSIKGRTPAEAAESKGYTSIVDIIKQYC
ncbi:hypothetical protein PMIN06_010959 [Paraphaeosphaeria minitans]